MSSSERYSERVVTAIAEREGVDPVDLDERLYDAVDPDALDALFADVADSDEPPSVQVAFTCCGYDVTVSDPVDVTLEQRKETGEADDAPDEPKRVG